MRQPVTIIVNGRQVEVTEDELSFNDVVALAARPFPTVVYHHGHADKPQGSLLPGDRLKVKDGMIIGCAVTGSA